MSKATKQLAELLQKRGTPEWEEIRAGKGQAIITKKRAQKKKHNKKPRNSLVKTESREVWSNSIVMSREINKISSLYFRILMMKKSSLIRPYQYRSI